MSEALRQYRQIAVLRQHFERLVRNRGPLRLVEDAHPRLQEVHPRQGPGAEPRRGIDEGDAVVPFRQSEGDEDHEEDGDDVAVLSQFEAQR